MITRRRLALLAAPIAALALTASALTASALTASAAPALASAQRDAAAARGTEIVLAQTAFGPALAVGSGRFRNYTLYYITSDHGNSYGCTTGATKTPVGPITCTGPSTDKNAEWPAITTSGLPVAGPGVSQRLLGRVYRKGVGEQVTYAGHPLYLFDQQAGAVTGEGWFEPGLPPWHGVWWLLSAAGQPVPWAGTLTTARVGGQAVLAEIFQTGVGSVSFPVYTFSGDQPGSTPACGATAACARAWPPVLTRDAPGLIGVPASGVGTAGLPGRLTQVTWNGRPLYLFSHEQLGLTPSGSPAAQGNGNGVRAFGGTFSLVLNP
jgi:predicted lipoprotein with Yx(FWY)xxD motif